MRKKKAKIESIGGKVFFSLWGSNGKWLCASKPVKRKSALMTTLKNNFPDFIIIDNS